MWLKINISKNSSLWMSNFAFSMKDFGIVYKGALFLKVSLDL